MKRKFSVLLIIMILIVSILAGKSYAAYSFTASMTASNQTVTASTEVIVTVKVSNLNVGDNGINSFSAYISYDDAVFENLTESSVEGLNGWKAAYAGTGKVTLLKTSFLKSDEEIMQISLKTKSGLAAGTQGEVKLTSITAVNGSDEISASSVSTTITIGTPGANPPTPIGNITDNNTTQIKPITNNNVNNSNNNTNTTVPTNNSTNNVSNQTENITGSDIPYTGSESGAMSKIIIGVILIALVTYIKIERMKDVQ